MLKMISGVSVLAAAGLVFAPVVHADAQSFIASLRAHGWTADGGDYHLLRNGNMVCSMLSEPGVNGLDVAASFYRNTDSSVSYNDAAEFVLLSVQHLCPWLDGNSSSTV